MREIKRILVMLSLCLTVMLALPCVAPEVPEAFSAEAATEIKLNTKKAYVTKGDKVKLKVIGTKKKVKWVSSNTDVAVVSSKGVVKGVKTGTATIVAKVNGEKYKCKVVVESPKLSKSKASVYKGEKITLSVKNTKQTVKWSTSNSKIAKVSQKGVVKGVKKGTAIITAKVGNKEYTCKVTVKNPVALKSISLNKSKLTLDEGEKYTLKVKYNPTNTTVAKEVKWTTSDKSVVKVKNGVVTAVAPGKAKITAIVGGKKAVCTITVKEKDVVAENVARLKNYINRYGSINSDGNRFIKMTDYRDGTSYEFGIIYHVEEDQLSFVYVSESTYIQSVLQMNNVDLSEDTEVASEYLIVIDAYNAGAMATATFDATEYSTDDTVYFELESGLVLDESDIQDLANAELRLAFSGWDLLLYQDLSMSLRDLGFTSY